VRGELKQGFFKCIYKNADGFISIKMQYDESVDRLSKRVTYAMIQ
jgi:hypothetical protein